jgi:phenylpropionate dioxygenase-like ring-hydroxylating dioxygenase large terminal subunit
MTTERIDRSTSMVLDEAGENDLFLAMRTFWHPVSYATDLGSEPRRVSLLGEELVIARMGDGVRCFRDICVHRGAALSLGAVEGGELRCPYHGWRYGEDGTCTAIPARFGMTIPSKARLERFHAVEQSGLIWVCLDDQPAMPIPRFPEYDDDSFRLVQGPSYRWETSAHRRIENFVDFAHFAWVHEGVLATRDHPEVPDHEVRRAGSELIFGRNVREPVTGFTGLRAEDPNAFVDVSYDYFLSMPLAVHFNRHIPKTGESYVMMMTASPVGPKVTNSFWFLARNYAFDLDDSTFVEFEEHVLEQDKPVVESQRPERLPVDFGEELSIRGIDRVSVEYRRWLIEMATSVRTRSA